MYLFAKILIGILVIVGLVVGGIYATGNGPMLTLAWGFTFGGPALPFNPEDAAPPPNYAEDENWAGLPKRDGYEDYAPRGVSPAASQGSAPVDVFFIHPTGYLAGDTWTFSMAKDTASEENTAWMMANQASAYNGCCNLYAPRYRQANIFAYFKDEDVREEVLAFAYQDVARAFAYFLENFSQGRPFIIASHSQGTHHGVRLLADQIDGTDLADRLVAAYLIGGGVASSLFESMQDIYLCNSPTDLGCAVHWDTYSDSALHDAQPERVNNVCTNPLTWKLNGGLADKDQHVGAMPSSGNFTLALVGEDQARGVVFQPLGEPIPQMLQAQCKDGVLFVSDQGGSPLDPGSMGLGGNYHLLDYPLFYMDIRQNAKLRAQTYLQR